MSEGAVLTSIKVCPGCGFAGAVSTYDIGSGPEWACPSCDMCWGAAGQLLNPDDVWRIPRDLYDALPEWCRSNPKWVILEPESDPSTSDQ